MNTVHEPKIDVPAVLKQFIGLENPTQQQVQAHFSKLHTEQNKYDNTVLFHALLVFYLIQSQLPLVERRVRTKGMKLGWVSTIPGVDYSAVSNHFWDYVGLNHIDTLVINN